MIEEKVLLKLDIIYRICIKNSIDEIYTKHGRNYPVCGLMKKIIWRIKKIKSIDFLYVKLTTLDIVTIYINFRENCRNYCNYKFVIPTRMFLSNKTPKYVVYSN